MPRPSHLSRGQITAGKDPYVLIKDPLEVN